MSAILLILLFFLGALLATIGGIIGVVDAFRVNTVWGLLALFIPFALLVFCIKFWNQRKWARNSLVISLLGLLAMVVPIPLAGGLGFLTARNAADQELEDFTIEGDDVSPGESATAPGAGPDETTEVPAEGAEGEADLFEEAMLPGLPTAAEIARAELLPSTDPNERFNEIDRERNDPYAFVPIPPPPRPTPPPPQNNAGGGTNTPAGAGAGTSPSPGTAQPGGAAASPRPGGGGQGATSGPGGGGQGSQPPAAVEPLPALPEPTVVASQVQISGVASVDGKTYAIVKAPNEPTSRYVQVGDRIANGTVLVKRIENRSGSAPVVVLEERGEEIALPVGANMSSPEEPTALASPPSENIAALPILPPVQ